MPRLPRRQDETAGAESRPAGPAVPAEVAMPETPAEEALFAALRGCFPAAAAPRQDFSATWRPLLLARASPRLRQDPRFAQATVADIYQHRRIRHCPGAAGRHGRRLARTRGQRAVHHPRPWRRWRCSLAPALAIPLLVLLNMAVAGPLLCLPLLHRRSPGTRLPAPSLCRCWRFGQPRRLLVRGHHGRWLLAGRLAAGSYPLWGLTYPPPLVAGDRLVDRARVPAQRIVAVCGVAAPAGRAHRARTWCWFHSPCARAAPGLWRGRHQHRQRRPS